MFKYKIQYSDVGGVQVLAELIKRYRKRSVDSKGLRWNGKPVGVIWGSDKGRKCANFRPYAAFYESSSTGGRL